MMKPAALENRRTLDNPVVVRLDLGPFALPVRPLAVQFFDQTEFLMFGFRFFGLHGGQDLDLGNRVVVSSTVGTDQTPL